MVATIVELMKGVQDNSLLIVTAPSNVAVDVLTNKLRQHYFENPSTAAPVLKRLHSPGRLYWNANTHDVGGIPLGLSEDEEGKRLARQYEVISLSSFLSPTNG